MTPGAADAKDSVEITAPPWPGEKVFFCILTAAAAVLFFYRLGFESLWFDEAWSIELAKRSLSVTLLEFLRTNREGPPLYYVLLHGWMLLFGQSEVALRSLSAAAATGAVALQFLLLRRLFTLRIAVLGSLLMATSRAVVHFAQEGRNYSLFLLLFCLSSYCFVRFLEQPKLKWALTVCAVNLAALLTHMLAVEPLFVESLVVVGLFWRERTLVRLWVTVHLPLCLCVLPYPLLVTHGGALASWVPQPNWRALWNVATMYGGVDFYENPFAARQAAFELGAPDRAITLLLLLLAAGAGGVYLIRRFPIEGKLRKAGGVLLVGFALICVGLPWMLTGLFMPVFVPRYLLGAIPAIVGLAAVAIDKVFARVDWGLGLSILLVSLCLEQSGLEIKNKDKDDWREAAEFISRLIGPGQALIVSDGRGVVPFRYYYHGAVEPLPVPASFGIKQPATEVERFLERVTKGAKVLWLVMPWGGSADNEKTGLWSFLDTDGAHFPLLGQRSFPGSWGGIRIHCYRVSRNAP